MQGSRKVVPLIRNDQESGYEPLQRRRLFDDFRHGTLMFFCRRSTDGSPAPLSDNFCIRFFVC
jgi:hypothetical protein